MIEEQPGRDWRDLQHRVQAILNECGLVAESSKSLRTARGTTEIDVYATDSSTTPPAIYFCECKRWQVHVPQGEVQAFRTVMSDAGANFGLFISAAGFQSGAFDVVQHTNIQLLDWAEFQALFVNRWYRTYMVPTMRLEEDPLIEYTEPINSRIFRRADGLSPERVARFKALRKRHSLPAMSLMMVWSHAIPGPYVASLVGDTSAPPPALPFRPSVDTDTLQLPGPILDATALRPLMQAVTDYYRQATAEFDEVFGGRA
jgi:hypothetical protein